jgi:hypothetical protein
MPTVFDGFPAVSSERSKAETPDITASDGATVF